LTGLHIKVSQLPVFPVPFPPSYLSLLPRTSLYLKWACCIGIVSYLDIQLRNVLTNFGELKEVMQLQVLGDLHYMQLCVLTVVCLEQASQIASFNSAGISLMLRCVGAGLANVLQGHIFVGMADDRFALLQQGTNLYLVDACVLSRDMLYQQVLRRFEHFEKIRVADSPAIHDLALLALENPAFFPEVCALACGSTGRPMHTG
jgi:hypothetical protein